MGLADFFLYGGSSGGGGGGSSLPSNWDVENNSLTIKGEGLNSLGWRCSNKDYYFEKSFSWTVVDEEDDQNFRTYDKINDTPGLVILFRFSGNAKSYCLGISTNAGGAQIKDRDNDNATRGSFEYLDHTWYYCRTNPGTDFGICDDLELITLSGVNDGDVEAAKLAIDYAGISFEASNDFTQLASPDKDYTIAAGGSASDFSDATFRVNSSGDVFGRNFYSNGVAISSAFTGATSSSAGAQGMVPAPRISDREKILKGDGTWMTQKPSLVSYSTNEQDTGMKWIDGSKIYQITKVYENVAQTSDSTPLTLDTLSDVVTMVRYDVRATTTGGGIINDNFYLDSSYKFHTIYYPDTKELQYRANWGGSGYFTITITYQYTRIPSLDDAVITTSNFNRSNVLASQQAYVYKNWRDASSVFNPGYRDINITADLDGSAVYMWSTYETAERIDGCDWLRYDHSESFVPYCVGIWAHSSNAWGGTYPTIYLEFSNDGTTWDTLYTGIPTIPAGTCCYIPVNTSNSYTKFRIRYNNGTGALGSEWNGALPNITIYGE